jgi:hypothetical protein
LLALNRRRRVTGRLYNVLTGLSENLELPQTAETPYQANLHTKADLERHVLQVKTI